ncbi:MAG: rubrerythrin family protein [Deltaproteobacteria bacterium]|nr:rubrerythrin family protein [Deltaproteobacteria bacterium]
MPTTLENLKTAFAGESQANRRYLAYARKAEQDGFPNVARLFRAAAEAETTHALAHLQAMGGVSGTVENLKDAIQGETYEAKEMYPPMLAQAQQEGHRGKAMIGMAMKVEQVHADLYQRALEAVLTGNDLQAAEIYVCPICGHVELGAPSQRCPVCNAAPEKYQKVS